MFKSKTKSEKNRKIIDFLDKTTFFRMLMFWIFIMFLFGLIYYSAEFFSGSPTGFFDKIYSSFQSGTNTKGAYGILSLSNFIIGLIIMSLITTKLVSLKHEKILESIHDISISEKVNRISNQLSEIKKDAFEMISEIEQSDTISRKKLFEIKGQVSRIQSNLNEIDDDLDLASFEKTHLEIISSGIYYCLQNLNRVIMHMKKNNMVFRNTALLDDIYMIITKSSKISRNFKSLDSNEELTSMLDEMYDNLSEFSIASSEFDSDVSPLIRN